MHAHSTAAAAPRPLGRALALIDGALEALAASLLVVAAGVAVLQVFFRYVLNDSLPWPEELAQWAFVWSVFVAMALAVGRRSHIAIDLLPRLLPPHWAPWHALAVQAIVAATCVMLVVHGYDFVGRTSYVSPGMGWPFKYLYLAVPAGATLALFYVARQRSDHVRFAGLLALALGVAVYAATRYAAGALVGPGGSATVLMAVAAALIVLQVPVAFALVFGAFTAFYPQGDLMLVSVPQNMGSSLSSFTLLAIPFFILAAAVMNVAGITTTLVELATRLVGHLRGGLGHVNVATNAMMAGVSGSSMADAAAIAKILVPEMDRRGYDRPFSCALTSASATLANLIPPSLGLIIYGALATVSVGALFVATIVPGLVTAAALALVVHFVSVRSGLGRDIPRADARARLVALAKAGPALLLPVAIVGGVRFGVFTATEAGAVAVVYALFCGALVYRELSARGLLAAVREALFDAAAVSVIIAAAAPFAWILAVEQVPQTIAKEMGGLAASPWLLLLVINGFLLVVGLFMEMIAAMVILVPILIPIVTAAGIDPVHFGIVLVLNLVIGALTPPLGMLIFTTARVAATPVTAVFRAAAPFIAGLVAALALVTYVPGLSLWLVGLIGP